MLIKVTQAHIDAGEFSNAELCPIALAVKEATGISSVVVFHDIHIDSNVHQSTPSEVFDKLLHFDRTGEMDPFEFEIKDFP